MQENESVILATKDIASISVSITNDVLYTIAVEFIKWGSLILLSIFCIGGLCIYLIKKREYESTDENRLEKLLLQIKDTNVMSKNEYLQSLAMLQETLKAQAYEVKDSYVQDLEIFKANIVKEISVNKDVLEAYKEFFKIKSLVYQDLDHKDFRPVNIVPIVYVRLNKTYKRLYDFEKTYGYVLPKDVANSLLELISDCQNGMNYDDIKSEKYAYTKNFITALGDTDYRFRKYLNIK